MNRRMILAVSLVTALAVLSGCSVASRQPAPSSGTGTTPAPAPAPAKKEAVVYGSTAEISGIDPHWRFSLQDMITLRAVFEPLLNVNKQGKFEPVLAESWSVSQDQKAWTFKLRQGVKFADGKPFTSKAVKATMDRVLNGKKLGFTFLFAKVSAVEAPDDSTIIIRTKEVDGPLLYNLSTLYIAPEDIADPKYLENPYEGKVGTGPFTIVEFKKGSGLTMQKNPLYWRSGLPKTEKLVIRPIPDEPAKIAALRSGDVQIVDGLSPDGLKTLEKEYNVLPEQVWQTEFLHLNTTRPPLNNPKVRQAINLAINRDMIAKDVIGIGAPNAVYPPQGLVGHNDTFAANTYDLKKAQALMKEAFPGGYNGPVLKLMSSPTYVKTEEVVQVIAEQLKEIGLKVEPQIVDAAARADMTASGTFDMAYLGSIAVTGDPARYLLERVVTDAYKTGYRNQAAFDAIIGATKETDPAKQDALYKKAQELMWAEAPIVYVYQDVWITATAKNLTGYVPMPHRLVDWATVGYGG
jgi:peptide/nickel transport system substrate-binding protein